MNKKDFVTLLRTAIRIEMRPIVKEVVQNEFRLLRESLVSQPNTSVKSREMLSEDISIDALIHEEGLLLRDVIEQEEAQEVETPPKRKLFKGENVFTNMLQQTIEEGYKAGMQKQVSNASSGQNLVQISGSPNRADILDAIGYGEIGTGEAASIPGTKVVQVPQTTPDGKPINPNAIPDFLLKAMNKDYSKNLKESKKADKRRHGG